MANVAIVGPFSRGVTFEVHAAGCADLKKTRIRRVDNAPWTFDAVSVQEIVEETFADHISQNREEAKIDPELAPWATWEGYANEFKFMPCCPELPEKTPVAKPRRCYTIAELIDLIAAIDPLCEPGSPEWREQTTLIRMLNAAEQHEAAH